MNLVRIARVQIPKMSSVLMDEMSPHQLLFCF